MQATATIERIIADTRYAVGDNDTRQAVAIIERPITDTIARSNYNRFYISWQTAANSGGTGNARQAGAIIERPFTDTRYAVSYRYTRQAIAISERPTTDTRYGVGNGNARQTTAIPERSIADTRYGVGNGNTRQAIAIIERRTTDFFDGFTVVGFGNYSFRFIFRTIGYHIIGFIRGKLHCKPISCTRINR